MVQSPASICAAVKISLDRRAQSRGRRLASSRRKQLRRRPHQRWTLRPLSENDAGNAPRRIDNGNGHGLCEIAKFFGIFRMAPTCAGGKARHQDLRDDFPVPDCGIQRPPDKVCNFDFPLTGRSR